MNRIKQKFQELKSKGESGLVGFVTAGDPDMQTSLSLIQKMCEAGMDLLELGIPFSDPTSDGPVIQRSSLRALQKGMTLAKALEMTAAIRQTTAIPIILFSYYNPILAYGLERFYQDGLKVGADGLLVVDLPPEESPEMTDTWPGDELALIRLVAPTTPQARMQTIAEGASGFLYLVSKTGVTGSAGLDTGAIAGHARNLRALTHLPICVGFGISTPEDVAAVARVADGVVIGSAFERLIEENLPDPDLPARVGRKAAQYKAATITPDK